MRNKDKKIAERNYKINKAEKLRLLRKSIKHYDWRNYAPPEHQDGYVPPSKSRPTEDPEPSSSKSSTTAGARKASADHSPAERGRKKESITKNNNMEENSTSLSKKTDRRHKSVSRSLSVRKISPPPRHNRTGRSNSCHPSLVCTSHLVTAPPGCTPATSHLGESCKYEGSLCQAKG